MAKCVLCGNSGLLLSVNKHGVCNSCVSQVYPTIIRTVEIFNESQKIITESKNYKTRLSRCDTINTMLDRLEPYEPLGLLSDVFPMNIQSIRQNNENIRKSVIRETIISTYEDIRAKINLTASPKSRITACNNGLLKLRGLKKEFGEVPEIRKVEQDLTKLSHTLQFKSFLEQAQKEEFKENYKKALDQYQEALYFLKTDEIDDAQQQGTIQKLEKKINELKLRITKPKSK